MGSRTKALLHETDSYENPVTRIVAKSNLYRQALETCLSVLGDANAKPAGNLEEAVTIA